MNSRKTLLTATTLLLTSTLAACMVLVAGEEDRPPPDGFPQPVLTETTVPFEHRWSADTAHPLLAAAAIDIDGDGTDEVFLGGSDGQADALIAWRNGALVDIAAQTGIGDDGATYGALSLDVNDDGLVDMLTAGHDGLTAWLNRGNRFERQSITAPIPESAVPMAITAGDYDRDGQVDLYVSMFVAPKDFRSPVFNDPTHAKRNLLLRGLGDLRFDDVTDAVSGGLQNTFTASFVDLDQDGWLDLALAQNTGEAEILRNLGDGTFERVPLSTGYGFWMGLAFGDLHGNGRLDVFFSNSGNSIPALFTKGDLREDQRAAQEWLLLRNDGGMRFTDITSEADMTGFGFAWGGLFEDINLDGTLDLLVAENYVKWPIHKLFKLPGKVLLGAPGKSPSFYTASVGLNPSYGHVPLIADLDGDGRNDILWANMNGQSRAFMNRTEARFLAVRLPDVAASVGARVRLEGTSAPVRYVIAGEGLTSDRTTQISWGLPKNAPAPTALIIEWPDGEVTRIDNPPLNKTSVIDRR